MLEDLDAFLLKYPHYLIKIVILSQRQRFLNKYYLLQEFHNLIRQHLILHNFDCLFILDVNSYPSKIIHKVQLLYQSRKINHTLLHSNHSAMYFFPHGHGLP